MMCSLYNLNSMRHCPSSKALGRGASGARRFIRFFWKGLISMGCGLGLLNLPVLRGLVQCGLLICSRLVVYWWVSTGSTLGYCLKVFTE